MKFSERKGLSPVRVELQRESIDNALRNKLWSALTTGFFRLNAHPFNDYRVQRALVQRLWVEHFKRAVDTAPVPVGHSGSPTLTALGVRLREEFFEDSWYTVYDHIEAIVQLLSDEALGDAEARDNLVTEINYHLETEMAAYRIVGGRVADITSDQEIEAIEAAQSDASALAGVRTHLQDALGKLTSRSAPDYRNSIKESISAVEALCQAITQDPSATLGKALKRLVTAGVPLHPSLEQAWHKLYGYTSDKSGIRHALSDEPTITFDDAKYMLVSCSSFITYLLSLAGKSGIAVGSPHPSLVRPT